MSLASARRRVENYTELVRLLKWVISWGYCGHCGRPSLPGEDFQFHHRNPDTKLFTIGDTANAKRSINMLMEEVKKCDVICHSCHVAAHHGRTVNGVPA